jgi:hypothetical protein
VPSRKTFFFPTVPQQILQFPVDNMFVTLCLYFRRTRRDGSGSPGPIRDHDLDRSPVGDHGQDHDQDDEKLSKSFAKGSIQVMDSL